MQVAVNLTPSSLFSLASTIRLAPPFKSIPNVKAAKHAQLVKAVATSYEVSAVDYSSMTSYTKSCTCINFVTTTPVFPAEACEIIGGDACDVEMYPEAMLNQRQAQRNSSKRAPETVDREYLDYDSDKTVFPGEACDDLGGEFCEAEYQKGVY